jgi:purine nucleoside permease
MVFWGQVVVQSGRAAMRREGGIGKAVRRRAWAMAIVALLCAPLAAAAADAPTEIRVVIVTTWEVERGGVDLKGELHAWRKEWPLKTEIDFPLGVHPLLYDPDRHVLAIVTGMATARAAASIMALGLDPRFDLSHAYWIVAGTAGADPKVASAGSVAWSRWVIDGDLAQELDPRDAPPDWPTGIVPYDRTTPYQTPAPPGLSRTANVAFPLNPKLVAWAFARSQATPLPDDAVLQKLRAPYAGEGAKRPFVLEGEGLMSARNWYGDKLNAWAERWVSYWTGGAGVFAMSAEEDSGILQALTQLDAAGRAKVDRVLVLRAASDYTVPPPGESAGEFLAKETKGGFPATPEALAGLYAVAAPVARYLADDWAQTRDHVPGP